MAEAPQVPVFFRVPPAVTIPFPLLLQQEGDRPFFGNIQGAPPRSHRRLGDRSTALQERSDGSVRGHCQILPTHQPYDELQRFDPSQHELCHDLFQVQPELQLPL